jgi:hypothetical protein
MTNGRGKDTMGETAKAYCRGWLLERIYGCPKKILTKEIQKGIMMEDEAIEYVAEVYGWFAVEKNAEQYQDEFITGTPDILLPSRVVDVKVPWDCHTFPLFFNEIPEKDYEWQVQGYMHLTGRRKASVMYVLLDTPEEIPGASTAAIPENLDELPPELRIKEYEFDYDSEKIEAIKERVILCREYISQILNI